jgi:hypothetical protein
MRLFHFARNVATIFACLHFANQAIAVQSAANSPGAPRMTQHASGSFDITTTPAAPPDHQGRTAIGRMLLDKRYAGELAATGKGEMLTAVTDTHGSAAYVAIERISGTLNGKRGSFVIQHAGTMSAGGKHATINVVPDSGAGDLTGISGTLRLTLVERTHFYELDYVLP